MPPKPLPLTIIRYGEGDPPGLCVGKETNVYSENYLDWNEGNLKLTSIGMPDSMLSFIRPNILSILSWNGLRDADDILSCKARPEESSSTFRIKIHHYFIICTALFFLKRTNPPLRNGILQNKAAWYFTVWEEIGEEFEIYSVGQPYLCHQNHF